MHEVSAISAIAQRDLLKFMRDPPRIFSTLVFPFIFIAALGGSLQAGFGMSVGYDFITFVFTGVFAQTLFQSSALGLVSLIEDRESDFSQEIFVSPISRYSIVFGKIAGESLVSLAQGAAILVFGLILGVRFSGAQLAGLVPVAVAVCLLGGAFGVIILANVGTQRAANQIFPFIFLPQFFLAGVFNPIQGLPPVLDVLSRISPMRYAVDLTRNVYYAETPERSRVVVDPLSLDLAVMGLMFGLFLVVGTWLFVRNERNR